MNFFNIFKRPEVEAIEALRPRSVEWGDMYLGEGIRAFVPETVEQAKAVLKRGSQAAAELHTVHDFLVLTLKWRTEKAEALTKERDKLVAELAAEKGGGE